ncbi:MAG: dipeptidase PepE [Planctomycetota bacterium]
MARKLLLISSSRVHGTGFLEHCAEAISKHFAGASSVVFVPYALADHDQYERTVAEAFSKINLELRSIHHVADPKSAVEAAEGVFIGGGNSFRLLKALYEKQLVDVLRQRVVDGMPYMGSSAGTNMSCPTIRTTNDMPIVEPPSFEALDLVPFQINPHYLDADPASTHKGETREQRLAEFHEENEIPVVALREGSWLEVVGDACYLRGKTGMKLFEAAKPSQEIQPNADLSDLLNKI